MKAGFIGDIHEDIISLKKAFSTLEEYGCTEFYCLGDFVGTFPSYECKGERDANAVVEMIRERCKATVIGNHDLSAIGRLPTEMPEGVCMPENYFELSTEERRKAAGWGHPDHPDGLWELDVNMLPVDLRPENAEWIGKLPEIVILELGGWSCALLHALRPNPTGYAVLYPHGDASVLKMQMQWQKKEGIELAISAHAHEPGLMLYRMGEDKIRTVESNEPVRIDRRIPTWVSIASTTVTESPPGVAVFDSADGAMVSIPLS